MTQIFQTTSSGSFCRNYLLLSYHQVRPAEAPSIRARTHVPDLHKSSPAPQDYPITVSHCTRCPTPTRRGARTGPQQHHRCLTRPALYGAPAVSGVCACRDTSDRTPSDTSISIIDHFGRHPPPPPLPPPLTAVASGERRARTRLTDQYSQGASLKTASAQGSAGGGQPTRGPHSNAPAARVTVQTAVLHPEP